jgi:hypothetical protein
VLSGESDYAQGGSVQINQEMTHSGSAWITPGGRSACLWCIVRSGREGTDWWCARREGRWRLP